MAEANRNIVVVGASAGGVEALQRLVAALPADFPAAVFVVLHILPSARSMLAAILSRAGPLPASQAKHLQKIRTGRIRVAPPDRHLMLDAHHMLVVRGPRENSTRPAINPLFRSAAMAHGARTIGVILTGTLDDGAAGLWAIKQCGGVAIVQSDAAFDQMPRSAAESVDVDFCAPLGQIPALLDRLVRERIALPEPTAAPAPTVVQDQGARMQPARKLDEVGRRSLFSCPDCNVALWEIEEGVLEYRCHVGHAHSSESLKHAQGSVIEQSLWSAVRALKESAALDERLGQRAAEQGAEASALRYRESASVKMEQVARLQEFLARFPSEKLA